MITRVTPGIAVLTTAPQRIRASNAQLLGLTVQNQESSANIFIRPGGDGHVRSYIKLAPDGDYVSDILPPQEEVWAYSDTDGAILTVWEKYRA